MCVTERVTLVYSGIGRAIPQCPFATACSPVSITFPGARMGPTTVCACIGMALRERYYSSKGKSVRAGMRLRAGILQ